MNAITTTTTNSGGGLIPRTMQEAMSLAEMMARGKLSPAPLLSAVAPLAEGASWFDRLYRKEPGLLKVVLSP